MFGQVASIFDCEVGAEALEGDRRQRAADGMVIDGIAEGWRPAGPRARARGNRKHGSAKEPEK